jgi:hypothetical protein
MGYYSTASGYYSTAMGVQTIAGGWYSTAMGVVTAASGNASTAIGYGTTASGVASTAMGDLTKAQGFCSTALGRKTNANGNYTTAFGGYIDVNGERSIGIGLNFHYPNWVVASNNVMSIMGGNVGIGTTDPDATLEVNGTMKVFGEWQDNLTYGTVYQADTDGFVSVLLKIVVAERYGFAYGYTDENNPPVTIRGYASVDHHSSVYVNYNSFLMPVKNGDYWKVDLFESGGQSCNVTISWIPLGT